MIDTLRLVDESDTSCVQCLDYEYHTYKDYGAGYDYYGGYEQQDDYGLYGPAVYSESPLGRGRGGRGAPAAMPRGITCLSVCLSVYLCVSSVCADLSLCYSLVKMVLKVTVCVL